MFQDLSRAVNRGNVSTKKRLACIGRLKLTAYLFTYVGVNGEPVNSRVKKLTWTWKPRKL